MTSYSTPLSYTAAFRIVAWKAAAYAVRRWELGPDYYCQTCIRPEKDLPNDCPRCPLSELFKGVYVEGATQEIEARGGFPSGVTINRLMADYARVSTLLRDNQNRVDPRWDVFLATLAQIVIDESDHQAYVQRWNLWRELQGNT